MRKEILDKLKQNKKFLNYLHENSNYYKNLNRDQDNYNDFVKYIKEKYKLRTIDKVDNFVDSVDLITKIIDSNNK